MVRVSLLVLAAAAHVASGWIAPRSLIRPLGLKTGLRTAADDANEDDDDAVDDDDNEVITMESLPELLQQQIIEAISRSRPSSGRGAKKLNGAVSLDGDGAPSLFVFADDEEEKDDDDEEEDEEEEDDDDESPFMMIPPVASKAKKKTTEKKRSAALERISRFDLRPRQVREHLDRYVVRQDDAKKVLSVAICDHYNVVRRCLSDASERAAEYSKPNILLLGPSGSGKTYIMRTLAKLLGVPFVKADATKFTETGIVGEDAEDLVRNLVEQADGDVELAQYGIIYVDEVDKLCRGEQGGTSTTGAGGATVGGGARGVQNTFLKVMEETEISVNKQSGMIPEIFLGGKPAQPARVSTKHVLFIFSGAFTGLDERLKRKHEQRSMGFGLEAAGGDDGLTDDGVPKSFLKKATSSDFVDAGLETEFIGRIPVRVAVDPLGARDLELILLQSEGSVLRQYERDFAGYGVDLEVTRDAIAAVAAEAAEEKTGARGLVTVLERTFRDFKYELPCAGATKLVCDASTVADPARTLAAALDAAKRDDRDAVRRADARRFEEQFAFDHAPLTVAIDAAAEDFLLAEAAAFPERSVRGVATARLLDDAALVDALSAIAKRTKASHFDVTLDLLLDKRATLDAWLAKAEADHPEPEGGDDDDAGAEPVPVASASSDDDDDDADEAEEAADALRRFLAEGAQV
jgi:endopeptidase Clp ATP-binding regulatory subunit ClpX